MALARRFLADGGDAIHFHHAPVRQKGSTLAFDILGRFGDRSDLSVLRQLSQSDPIAKEALSALKALDAGRSD